MTDDATLRDQAVAELEQTTIAYPAWLERVHGGTYDPKDGSGTHWGKALALLAEIGASPSGWTCAPPQPPIHTVQNATVVALNVNNTTGGTFTDYEIDGTNDSAVLLQGSTTGCTVQRVHATRIDCVSPSVTWGVHGVYCKAPGNSLADIYVDGTGGNPRYLGSGFSVRFGANTFTRTVTRGFYFAASYFEEDNRTRAPVQFVDGDWQATHPDTVVWMDGAGAPSGGIVQSFLFRGIAATSPAPLFLSCKPGTYKGGAVTIL